MKRTKLKMNSRKGETGFLLLLKQRDAIAQERGFFIPQNSRNLFFLLRKQTELIIQH